MIERAFNILCGGLLVVFIGALVRAACTPPHDLGIYPSNDGQAVFLAGEACEVNYSPDPIIFHSRLEWCFEEYNRHQAVNQPLR